MLVITRLDGQWVEVTHAASGDLLRICLLDIAPGHGLHAPARVNLAFDDAARNFDIQRPERFGRRPSAPAPTTPEPGA